MPKQMTAAVLEAPTASNLAEGKSTPQFTLSDNVEIIDPRAGEVRVRVKHCGICHSDLSVADGVFPVDQPIILGHEAAGIVDAVGLGITHLAPGDPVVLTPAAPCGDCYYCQRDEHSLCVDSLSLMTHALPSGDTGLSRDGSPVLRGVGVAAFAEYAITTAHGAVKIPADVPLEVACVIGCAMQTGAGAVFNIARLEPGATALIMGLGGVGLAAVQGAVIAGASSVIVSDPIAGRRELARSFGATHLLDPEHDDVLTSVREITGGIGVDYAFETAGVGALLQLGHDAIRNGGALVCVGAPPLDAQFNIDPVALFVTSQKRILGCLLGGSNSPHEIPRLIGLWRTGRLQLEQMITARRPLSDIGAAFDDLRQGVGVRTVLNL